MALDNLIIGATDVPAESDSFGINSYINSMVQFIENCDTPLTISIQGTWGTGKTSFMKMVEKDLVSRGHCHFIEFNTWQFSQFNMDENLSINLIKSLIDKMGLDPDDTKKALKTIGTLGKLIGSGAAVAFERISGLGNLGGEIGEVVKKVSQALVDSDEGNPIAAITELHDKFEECVEKCKAKRKVDRIVVFIDDLDRLEPRKAVELLEVLKNFLDCQDCVFVLAIDYDVVCRGVAAKYGGTDGKSILDKKKGKDFFDKIIQVPFKLPVARYDIEEYLKTCLTKIVYNNSFLFSGQENFQAYHNLVITSIGTNPRAIKRLCNSFQFIVMVAQQSEDFDMKEWKLQMFAILCLQEMDFSVYNAIIKEREKLSFDMIKCWADKDENLINEYFPEVDYADEEGADLDRISLFMDKLANIIDIDGKNGVSDKEMEIFKRVLDFSSITATDSIESTQKRYTQRNAFQYKGERYASHGTKTLGMLIRNIIIDEIIKPSWTRVDMENFMQEASTARKRWKGLQRMVIFDEIEKYRNDLFMDTPITFADGSVGYPWRWWSADEVERMVDLLDDNFDIVIDCSRIE